MNRAPSNHTPTDQHQPIGSRVTAAGRLGYARSTRSRRSLVRGAAVVCGLLSCDAEPATESTPALGTLPRLAVSSVHACVIRDDGTVWCVGQGGEHSLLGNGANDSPTGSVQVRGLRSVVGVAASATHTCALRADGAVFCWGQNEQGELGDGTETGRNAPVQVSSVADAVEVRVAPGVSCARRRDSSLWCWGYVSGMNHSQPVRVGATSIRGLGLSQYSRPDLEPGFQRCTIRDGAVECFRPAAAGQPQSDEAMESIQGPAGAVEVAGAGGVWCARTAGGEVWCWGRNTVGQLGAGDQTAHVGALRVPGVADASSLSVSAFHACAARRSGAVVCWGSNTAGESGGAWMGYPTSPQPVEGLADVTEVAVVSSFSCARRRSGEVACWGALDAQTAHSIAAPPSVVDAPQAVQGLRGVTSLVGDGDATCAFGAGSPTRCWGGGLSSATESTSVYPWVIPTPDGTFQGVTSFVYGFGIRSDRSVGEWGWRSPDQPRTINLGGFTEVIAVARTDDTLCAVRADGSVLCAGGNAWHQLANGTQARSDEAVTIPGLPPVTAIAASEHALCALAEDRTVHCWGRSLSGETGQSGPTMGDRPVAVPDLSDAVAIASDHRTVFCAVRATGQVVCWGNPEPTGPARRRVVPGIDDAVRVVMSAARRCALTRDGAVSCWSPMGTTEGEPSRVAGLANVSSLVGGNNHWCASTTDGSVLCWGRNDVGQLGTGCAGLGCAAPRPLAP